MRFPPIRYCQISSTSLQRQRCIRVLAATAGGIVKGGRGSGRLQFDSPGQLRQFSRATKKVLACSHSRLLQLLCTAGGNQARLDARTEFKISERSLKGGGGEAGRAIDCTT